MLFSDVTKCISVNSKITCFADDALITVSAKTAAEVRARVSAEISSINEYCCSNMMSLNKTKTKWMLVFPDARDQVADILLEGVHIERVTTFKYLGVILDHKLDFTDQTCSVISRIKRTMYIIRRSSYYSSRKSSMLLFHALIMPTFAYAIEVWYCTNMTNRGSLELILRHCARIVLGDIGPRPMISNSRLYELVNITPLQLYFQFKVGCLLYTIIHHTDKAYSARLFKPNDSKTYLLREPLPFIEQFTRRERSRVAICYWGPKFWNNLNSCIRDSHTLDEFKKRYSLYNQQGTLHDITLPRYFYDFI